MSGAEFILAINLCGAALLGGLFLGIGLYERRQVSAFWFAGGYFLGMVYSTMEFVTPWFADARFPYIAAFIAFLATTLMLSIGLAKKYRIRPPLVLSAAFIVASITTVVVLAFVPGEVFVSRLAYQLPFAVVQLAGAAFIIQSRVKKDIFDYLLAGIFTASGLQFLAKPFVALYFEGDNLSIGSYLRTGYAMVSQSMGTIFTLAVALALLVVFIRDILAEATAQSETDTLSGLLNRRGLDRLTTDSLRSAAARGEPVSIAVCDLDHFKSINDSFGHAAGDQVIQIFAGLLRDLAPPRSVIGRPGGEEFSIVMPGTPLAAARLFAESARAALSAMVFPGTMKGRNCTASFGIAELGPDESVHELTARADAALYEAKNSGRNCVRVSPTSDATSNLIYPFGTRTSA